MGQLSDLKDGDLVVIKFNCDSINYTTYNFSKIKILSSTCVEVENKMFYTDTGKAAHKWNDDYSIYYPSKELIDKVNHKKLKDELMVKIKSSIENISNEKIKSIINILEN